LNVVGELLKDEPVEPVKPTLPRPFMGFRTRDDG
jgi:hypothetical protein